MILHQNLTSGNFLMVSCNVESETILINFLHSVPLKSFGLYYTLKGYFTQLRICNIMRWSFEKNTSSLSYADLPNVDIFHYTINKTTTQHSITFVNNHPFLQKVWEAVKFILVNTSFSIF